MIEEPRRKATVYDQGAGNAPKRHGSHGSGKLRKAVLWLVAGLVLLAATVAVPEQGPWLVVKTLAMAGTGIALAFAILSQEEWTWRRFGTLLRSGPNPWILMFLVWVGISVFRSELPALSRYEAMRHLSGALLYFGVVYGLSVRRHLGNFLALLGLAGAAGTLVAVTQFSGAAGPNGSTGQIAGAFVNAQLLAAFLCLLLPLILVASQSDERPWRRTAAQVAVVFVAAGILVARNRSAWFGSLTALLILAVLYILVARREQSLNRQAHALIIPLATVAVTITVFLGMSQMGGTLSQRAGTITGLARDESFQWRLAMWDKATRMTRDRPLFGWGVGTFPVQQALYFHPEAISRDQAEISQGRISLAENAHNTYLQLAAELGLPGLALYLALIVAFFVTALRRVRHVRRGFRRWVLIGTVAAVGGQLVAAIGTPAWEYPECSHLFWIVLGLGMAVAELDTRGRGEPEPNPIETQG